MLFLQLKSCTWLGIYLDYDSRVLNNDHTSIYLISIWKQVWSQNSLKKKAAYMGSFHLNIAQIVI